MPVPTTATSASPSGRTDRSAARGVSTPGDARRPAPGPFWNLRDTGGLPTPAGPTRRGVLLRGDLPVATGTADLAEVAAAVEPLGLGLVVDLRSDEEATDSPSAFAALGLPVVRHDLLGVPASLVVDQAWTLRRLTTHLLLARGETLVAAARDVARTPGPVLVHCTAGKDRTGVLVAALLHAVGVPAREVAADYAVSGRRLGGAWLDRRVVELRGLHPEGTVLDPALLAGAPAGLMLELLVGVRRRWGGAAGLLRAHGLDAADLEALRARLVTSTTGTAGTAA